MTTSERSKVRFERSAKRVRAFLGGVPVADSRQPYLVWEHGAYPAYYLPVADVRMDLLAPSGRSRHREGLGDARLFTVTANGRTAEEAAWRYEQSPVPELRDLVRFAWSAMDAWFEEDEEVYTHPRDPYKRIDILASSRRIRVELDGVTIAESDRPYLLFETGLPVRYYLPKPDVRLDLLEPSTKITHCPYKGTAEHLSARLGDTWHPDIAWTYRTPFPESAKIAGLIAFYPEKVSISVEDQVASPPA